MPETPQTKNCVRQITMCSQCGKRVTVSTLLPQGFMATVNYHNSRSGCCNAYNVFFTEIVGEERAFDATTYPVVNPTGAIMPREELLMNVADENRALAKARLEANEALCAKLDAMEKRALRAEHILRDMGVKVDKAKRSHKKKVQPQVGDELPDVARGLT